MLLRRSPQNPCYVGILAGEAGLRPTTPSALGFHVTNTYRRRSRNEKRSQGPGTTERVDAGTDGAAPKSEPESDPQSNAGPRVEAATSRRREVDEDRRDHEGCGSPEEFNDGGDALEVAGERENPATNSAGVTVAPSPSPVNPEPTRVNAWLEGTSMRKTAIPAARSDHAGDGR